MKTEVKLIDETYTIRGEKVDVVANARFDVDSGEQVFDEKLDNKAILSAFDKYRNDHGIISPERIKELRHSFGLSQRDFATLLGWSATTIATYETGSLPSKANNKILLALENDHDLAQPFYDASKESMTERGKAAFKENTGISEVEKSKNFIEKGINTSFADTNYSEFSGYNAFDLKKFSNMVLYFASNVSELTKTKLNKLLFYTDFAYFSLNTVSISGAAYARLPHGPVPNNYSLLYGSMESANLIVEKENSTSKYDWSYYAPNAEFNAALFSKDELAVMHDTLERFKDMNATSISALSHKEDAWIDNDNHKLISYDYANSLTGLKN
ncbi:type II TA system antitoxin MqsA family protein [Lentilactobacillus kosonis]|nr:type II TA system antitoxin MqsA family protein [Lentilactobacillus kosonis]